MGIQESMGILEICTKLSGESEEDLQANETGRLTPEEEIDSQSQENSQEEAESYKAEGNTWDRWHKVLDRGTWVGELDNNS
ncbi:hypothetical protein JCM12825_21110 [Desulfurobacterium crinifex]